MRHTTSSGCEPLRETCRSGYEKNDGLWLGQVASASLFQGRATCQASGCDRYSYVLSPPGLPGADGPQRAHRKRGG